MAETKTTDVIQETNGTETDSQEARTFTQEEVDAIVMDRLWRDRAKHSDYEDLKAKAKKYDEMEEANKTELQKATERADALQTQLDAMTRDNEIRTIRENVARDTNVPVALLTGTTEEECAIQAKAILEFAKPNGYPKVKDTGEHTKVQKKSEVDQFADWFAQATR